MKKIILLIIFLHSFCFEKENLEDNEDVKLDIKLFDISEEEKVFEEEVKNEIETECEYYGKRGDLKNFFDFCWQPPQYYCSYPSTINAMVLSACNLETGLCCNFGSCVPCNWKIITHKGSEERKKLEEDSEACKKELEKLKFHDDIKICLNDENLPLSNPVEEKEIINIDEENKGCRPASAISISKKGDEIMIAGIVKNYLKKTGTDILVIHEFKNNFKEYFLGGKDEEFVKKFLKSNDFLLYSTIISKLPGYEHEISKIWIKKLASKSSVEEWDKFYILENDKYEYYADLSPTFDGGYIGVGSKKHKNHWIKLITKWNNNLEKQWEKEIYMEKKAIFNPKLIKETFDKGYIIGGEVRIKYKYYEELERLEGVAPSLLSYEKFRLIKLNENAEIEWTKDYGERDFNKIIEIFPQQDNTFLFGGWRKVNEDKWGDIWIVKIDKNGEILWEKTYGGKNIEVMKTMERTFDKKGFIIGGYVRKLGSGLEDALVLKINENGNEKWRKYYKKRDINHINAIIPLSSTEYIAAGFTKKAYEKCIEEIENWEEGFLPLTVVCPCYENLWILKISENY